MLRWYIRRRSNHRPIAQLSQSSPCTNAFIWRVDRCDWSNCSRSSLRLSGWSRPMLWPLHEFTSQFVSSADNLCSKSIWTTAIWGWGWSTSSTALVEEVVRYFNCLLGWKGLLRHRSGRDLTNAFMSSTSCEYWQLSLSHFPLSR